MSTADSLDDLRSRILAGYPLMLLRTYEEQRWEDELAELALEMEYGLVTWTSTSGAQPSLESPQETGDAVGFLAQLSRYPSQHLFLLKDLRTQDADVARKLRDLLPHLIANRQNILLMSPVENLPAELLKDVTVIELPLPGPEEMRRLLSQSINVLSGSGEPPAFLEEDRLAQAVLGLTLSEARNAFAKVFRNGESEVEEVLPQLVAEKRHLIQGSNLLEFFNLDEGVQDIGGLDGLKEWISQRVSAFSSEARTRGISNPRGVLLAGVQGCGKSLSTARAIARMLGFPLVRLDIGTLLESTRGGSEQNLRDVLKLMDTIAPAVLWLEEIDKALAGFEEDAAGDATMSRLIGRFLTWLQEHTAPVFVVATANRVSALPPEMLRRGRFDELFFIDLPNFHERREIYRIHLAKRGWKPERFDIDQLAEQSDGYSGAEIEEVVNSTIIESFAENRMPTQEDLIEARERTVPLSITMEDEIFHLREWARSRCRPATLESRVMEVLDAEQRRGEAPKAEQSTAPKWIQLAEHGQLAAAIVEHVRLYDHVTWPRLLKDFAPYAELKGDYGLVLRADPKVAICVRISKQLTDVICEYLDGKRLYLHPVPLEDIPGAARPNLPVIESVPQERVNKPVWLPTKLRLLPPPTGSGQLAHVARIRMGK